jgi:hypothetical protein
VRAQRLVGLVRAHGLVAADGMNPHHADLLVAGVHIPVAGATATAAHVGVLTRDVQRELILLRRRLQWLLPLLLSLLLLRLLRVVDAALLAAVAALTAQLAPAAAVQTEGDAVAEAAHDVAELAAHQEQVLGVVGLPQRDARAHQVALVRVHARLRLGLRLRLQMLQVDQLLALRLVQALPRPARVQVHVQAQPAAGPCSRRVQLRVRVAAGLVQYVAVNVGGGVLVVAIVPLQHLLQLLVADAVHQHRRARVAGVAPVGVDAEVGHINSPARRSEPVAVGQTAVVIHDHHCLVCVAGTGTITISTRTARFQPAREVGHVGYIGQVDVLHVLIQVVRVLWVVGVRRCHRNLIRLAREQALAPPRGLDRVRVRRVGVQTLGHIPQPAVAGQQIICADKQE